MANHKSALKRIRSDRAKNERNRYQLKTARTYVKKLRATSDKEEAKNLYPKVASMLDKLAKKNIIHKKKADNRKASLAKHMNSLS